MTDIVRVLPDAIANQIAAGEVVQRPASVVKELMDNAIDAEATEINVFVEDAGKNLIRVIDNGKGMSMTDARMAFERHATSKISIAEDLFSIRTMGFRGEALASIAAVAHIDLKTREKGNPLGTHLVVNGSELISQNQANCTEGSHFIIKNLFFNIPARRKFLKTNATEFRHIENQFKRLALAHPQIAFTLTHDDVEVYNLPKTNLKQRIVHLFGTSIQSQLIVIESVTSVTIRGYIGKPEKAKKRFGEQFFFVNNRYIRHPYLHKAVMEAYGQLLPVEGIPSYFIFIEIAPELLDVNIHPTKTEVKFEDERLLFQLMLATIKEALGRYNIVPSIDFDTENGLEIPIFDKEKPVVPPQIDYNPDYNPFKESQSEQNYTHRERKVPRGWEGFYDFEKLPNEEQPVQQQIDEGNRHSVGLFQVKGKYILSQVKSGIMFVHQQRAHERIVFEQIIKLSREKTVNSQRLLFPHIIELNATLMNTFEEIADEVQSLGFEIDLFGKNTISISGMPGGIELDNLQEFFEDLLDDYRGKEVVSEQLTEDIANALAKSSAMKRPQLLNEEEMQQLINSLFACKTPNHTPDGRKILYILPTTEVEKYFL